MENSPILKPHHNLRSLDRLVGSWRISGPEIEGAVTFKWLAGGFFLVQKGWLKIWGRKIEFVEYIGYDAQSGSCVSHLFDNFGDFFTYAWEVASDSITIWFGQKGSSNLFKGKFTKDGNSYSGAWKWPGGGYNATARRIK